LFMPRLRNTPPPGALMTDCLVYDIKAINPYLASELERSTALHRSAIWDHRSPVGGHGHPALMNANKKQNLFATITMFRQSLPRTIRQLVQAQ